MPALRAAAERYVSARETHAGTWIQLSRINASTILLFLKNGSNGRSFLVGYPALSINKFHVPRGSRIALGRSYGEVMTFAHGRRMVKPVIAHGSGASQGLVIGSPTHPPQHSCTTLLNRHSSRCDIHGVYREPVSPAIHNPVLEKLDRPL